MQNLVSALHFLINTLLTSFIALLILRLLLQWVRADFYNPLCELIIKVTNPVLVPVRRYIPGVMGIDWATIVVLVIAALLNQVALILLSSLAFKSVTGILLLTIAEILKLTYYIYLFSLIAMMFTSFFSQGRPNPMLQPLAQLVAPPLKLLRAYIQPLGKFDLSSFVLVLALIILNMIVIHPLRSAGIAMLVG